MHTCGLYNTKYIYRHIDNNNDIQYEHEEQLNGNQGLFDLNICSYNIQGLAKYEGDVNFQQYFKQFDLIGLCETLGVSNDCFTNILDGYVTLNNVRPKKRSAFRSSGGISVLIKETLIQTSFIKRIFDDFNECIVLLLDGQKFVNQNDIIIVFAYVAPERSTFYADPAINGIELLADKILSIISEYPNADLL